MKVWGGRSSGQVQAPCGRRWLPHAWPATQLAAVRAGPACSVRPDQSRIGLPRDARGACPRSGVCGQHWGQTVPEATLQRLSGAGSLALRGRAAAATRVFGINIEVRAPSLPSPQPPLRSPALPWPLCLKHLQGTMSTTKCGRAVRTSPKSFISSMSTLNSHRGGWGAFLPHHRSGPRPGSPGPSLWQPPTSPPQPGYTTSPRRGRRCRACSAAPSSAGVQAARPPGAGTLVREAWTPGLSRCRGPRALGRHRDPECHGQQWAAPRTGLAAQHAGAEQGGPSGPWCSGSLVLGKGSGDPVPATGHSRPLPHALLCAHGLCRRGGLLGPGPVASAVSHPAAICRRPGRAQAGPGSVPGPSCLDVGGHHVGWVPLPGGRKLSAGEGKQLAPGCRSCGGAGSRTDPWPSTPGQA